MWKYNSNIINTRDVYVYCIVCMHIRYTSVPINLHWAECILQYRLFSFQFFRVSLTMPFHFRKFFNLANARLFAIDIFSLRGNRFFPRYSYNNWNFAFQPNWIVVPWETLDRIDIFNLLRCDWDAFQFSIYTIFLFWFV